MVVTEREVNSIWLHEVGPKMGSDVTGRNNRGVSNSEVMLPAGAVCKNGLYK